MDQSYALRKSLRRINQSYALGSHRGALKGFAPRLQQVSRLHSLRDDDERRLLRLAQKMDPMSVPAAQKDRHPVAGPHLQVSDNQLAVDPLSRMNRQTGLAQRLMKSLVGQLAVGQSELLKRQTGLVAQLAQKQHRLAEGQKAVRVALEGGIMSSAASESTVTEGAAAGFA